MAEILQIKIPQEYRKPRESVLYGIRSDPCSTLFR